MDVLGIKCKWTPTVITRLKGVLMMLIDEWWVCNAYDYRYCNKIHQWVKCMPRFILCCGFLFIFFLLLLCCQQWQGWCQNQASSSVPSPSFEPVSNSHENFDWINQQLWPCKQKYTNSTVPHMKNIVINLTYNLTIEINLVETVLICYVVDKDCSCIKIILKTIVTSIFTVWVPVVDRTEGMKSFLTSCVPYW